MNYEAKWNEYRRRRRLFFAIFLSYVPGVWLVAIPVMYWFGSETPVYFIAGAWMIAFAVAGSRVSMFPCPRCGKWFFATWYFHNPLARRCVHCGLPKWATRDAATA